MRLGLVRRSRLSRHSLSPCGDDDSSNAALVVPVVPVVPAVLAVVALRPHYSGTASGWRRSVVKVSVCVHETEIRTTTDADGNFALEGAANEIILTFVKKTRRGLPFLW